MNLELTSPAFADGGAVPSRYACDGADVSPPLDWIDPPEGTKSLALICDDPDAPMGTWVHGVLYGIAADRTTLREGVPTDPVVKGIGVQGKNDFKRVGYGGPCPRAGHEGASPRDGATRGDISEVDRNAVATPRVRR